VGSDKIKANIKAVELLEREGYPQNTSFELIKVYINIYIIYI
jgi:hypothetical protein